MNPSLLLCVVNPKSTKLVQATWLVQLTRFVQLNSSIARRLVCCLFCAIVSGNAFAESIKLNQIAYSPNSSKIAVVPAFSKQQKSEQQNSSANSFRVIDINSDEVVFKGTLGSAKVWEYSGETVRLADLSGLNAVGSYRVLSGASQQSHVFDIAEKPLLDVHNAAAKAFYFNRSAMAVTQAQGGDFARAAGHLDVSVVVHRSAATKQRPAGTVLSASKGWYDAGDYGKYVVNSGISTYTLLKAYQDYRDFYAGLDLDIANTESSIPDILSEIKWNLDWLETMQDLDGGVYHKLTALKFSSMESMPEDEKSKRYMIGKSSSAALNFAAVLATASRVMRGFEKEFPGLADRYQAKAISAYRWAQANPKEYFSNPSDVSTGEYKDKSIDDEFAWAAAELFLATGDSDYLNDFVELSSKVKLSHNISWPSVAALAYMSLSSEGSKMLTQKQTQLINSEIIAVADELVSAYQASAYRVAITEKDFVWGSNGEVLNNGVLLIQAYQISKEQKYLEAAMSTLNYVLGQNPTGFSYVTGHGDKTPQNIHHRPSSADGIQKPVPGFIAGGPHAGKQDGCNYEHSLPASTFSDTLCSYATNEIAINWNAPLVYMLAAATNLSD